VSNPGQDYCLLVVRVYLVSWGPAGPRVDETRTFTMTFGGRHYSNPALAGGASVSVYGNMVAVAGGCRSYSGSPYQTLLSSAFALLEITNTGLVARHTETQSVVLGGSHDAPTVSVDVSSASGVALVAWSASHTGNTVIARWDGSTYAPLATVGGGFAQVATGMPDPWEAYYSRGGTVYRRTASGEAAVGSGSDPHVVWGPWGSMATWRDGGTAFRAHLVPAGGTAETYTVPYYADTADTVPDTAPAVRMVPGAPGYAVSAGRVHLIPWVAAVEDNTILITLPDRTRLLRRSGTSWVAVEVTGGGARRDITVSHTGTQVCLRVDGASSCASVASTPEDLGVVRWGGLGLELVRASNGRQWGWVITAGRWGRYAGADTPDAPVWPVPVMPMGASVTWDPWRPASEALPPAGLTGGEAGLSMGTYVLPAGQTQPAPVIAPVAGAVAPAGVSPSWLAALLAIVLIPGAAVAAWRITTSLAVTAVAVVALLWLLVVWGPLPLWLGVTGTLGTLLVYAIQARAY
jgi:hypothetical protein